LRLVYNRSNVDLSGLHAAPQSCYTFAKVRLCVTVFRLQKDDAE